MYKAKDRKTPYLFKELMPFGGALDENNRWLKIGELIPWERLEGAYAKYFSSKGRPGTDARLGIGLFLLKHLSGKSDEELVLELQENPYWQRLCGLESFGSGAQIESSTMSRLRKRLGPEYVKELERATYAVLIEKKLLKGKGMLADGTVIPENIRYPTDVKLLNEVREWLVRHIKKIGTEIGTRYRTYSRVGRKAYLRFAKNKRKSKKEIARTKKQMLQFVRRNVGQLKQALEEGARRGRRHAESLWGKLKTAEQILAQQAQMYREKSYRVADRIVSFCRPWVRPIKRGKDGKDVEFGAKAAMSHVDGYVFLDKISHDNFSESAQEMVREQVAGYEERFGHKPKSFTGDQAYGSRANRDLLEGEEQIRTSFVRLGRKQKGRQKRDQWFKRKQRERNRIEGDFGNGKEHYGLARVLYHGPEGSEIWTRGAVLAMNLKTALRRM